MQINHQPPLIDQSGIYVHMSEFLESMVQRRRSQHESVRFAGGHAGAKRPQRAKRAGEAKRARGSKTTQKDSETTHKTSNRTTHKTDSKTTHQTNNKTTHNTCKQIHITLTKNYT